MRLEPVLAAIVLAAAIPPAYAGTADFVDLCVAHADDFSAIPAAVTARGLVEVDASNGPQLMVLPDEAERRLWQNPAPEGAKSDLYVGLISIDGATPMDICFSLGLPGDNAEKTIADLQAAYPPLSEPRQRPAVFYGGDRSWFVDIDGADYVIGVIWPFAGMPETGPSSPYLLKLGAPSDPR